MRSGYQLQRLSATPPIGNRVLAKVSANATGNGVYTGKIQRPPTADVNKNNNLTASMLGVDGPPCVIVNTQEVAGSGHNLTVGDVYHGKVIRLNSDGTPVVAVDGCQCCACSFCTNGTPKSWTLSASGIALCLNTCISFNTGAGTSSVNMSALPNPNGTYTLTQGTSPSGCCFWSASVAGTITGNAYSDGACTTGLQNITNGGAQSWILQRAANGSLAWSLAWSAALQFAGVPSSTGVVTFYSTLSAADGNCFPTSLSFSNAHVCGDFLLNSGGPWPINPSSSAFVAGNSGTAVLTPNA